MTSDAFSFSSSNLSLLSSWVKSWVSLWPALLTRFIIACERDSVYMECVQSYRPWGTWDTRGIGGRVSILLSSVVSWCMIVVLSWSLKALSWWVLELSGSVEGMSWSVADDGWSVPPSSCIDHKTLFSECVHNCVQWCQTWDTLGITEEVWVIVVGQFWSVDGMWSVTGLSWNNCWSSCISIPGLKLLELFTVGVVLTWWRWAGVDLFVYLWRSWMTSL